MSSRSGQSYSFSDTSIDELYRARLHDDEPTFSLIIPVRNSEYTLDSTLKNLQDIKNEQVEIEIIVLDDASTDNSYEVAKEYDVKIIKNEYPVGRDQTILTGIKKSIGKYVALYDLFYDINPFYYLNLLKTVYNYDLVIASARAL